MSRDKRKWHTPFHGRRRKLLGAFLGTGALGIAHMAKASIDITSSQSEGPFYPQGGDRYEDMDNDLVKLEHETREAGGEILHLSGRVISASGQPLENARVEIWQCDARGRYLHHLDRGESNDRYFQGFGSALTGSEGQYQFRTIRPVRYTGRTPHIHFKVFESEGGELLTTQMYVQGEPGNESDFLYRRLSDQQKISLTVAISGTDTGELQASFDIVVNSG
jgi:protocatechuate 3,4-dioxygenase beta subunit